MRLIFGGILATGICGAAIIASAPMSHANPDNSAPPAALSASANTQSLSSDEPGTAGRSQLAPEEASFAAKMRLLPEGTRSLLAADRQLTHGEYLWDDADVPDGEITVWVDLRRQMLSVFRGGHEIGTAVIVYGSAEKETPIGTFPIGRKYRDYHSRTYDAPMPFSMFITNDGVALHGSRMVPIRATHGCVGLPNEFAEKLFEETEAGDLVSIVRSEPDTAPQPALASNS